MNDTLDWVTDSEFAGLFMKRVSSWLQESNVRLATFDGEITEYGCALSLEQLSYISDATERLIDRGRDLLDAIEVAELRAK